MSLQEENFAFPNKNLSKIDCASSDIEKNDGANFGQSLIKFMNLATGSVKTALQKPANYKKNINHRRYLQKQLKICTRRKKRNTKTKTGSKAKKDLSSAATEVWMGQADCGEVYIPSGTVRSEEFSSCDSLFLPYEVSLNCMQGQSDESYFQNFSSLANGVEQFQTGMVWNSFTHSCQEQTSISLQQANNNGAFFRDDMIPDILDEETEQFLTGEELTDALDIKDLFRPDRVLENEYSIANSCTFDENMYNCFQTVPSTASILSW